MSAAAFVHPAGQAVVDVTVMTSHVGRHQACCADVAALHALSKQYMLCKFAFAPDIIINPFGASSDRSKDVCRHLEVASKVDLLAS